MRSPLLVALLVSAVPAQQPANVSGGELRADQACFDVHAVSLHLEVLPATREIRGACRTVLDVVEETRVLALDLDGALTVDRVEVADKRTGFQHRDGRIRVELPRPLPAGRRTSLAVHYHGRPRVARRPPWSGGFTWAETPDGEPWIATSCQGEGADLWWPCKDHPSDEPEQMDLLITVPEGLVVASNGTLEGEHAVEGGRRRFHWHVANPINAYCVALNIAPYRTIEREHTCVDGTEMPVVFYVLPHAVEEGKKALPEFLDHLRFMEEVCGPYPFRDEKYGIAHTPFLGMEHQTIIAYGNDFRRRHPGYDWLHQHELSHEWWGNLVTNRDWKDMWIHEGIGTYMQPLYLEDRFGQGAYDAELWARRPLLRNRRAVAPRSSRTSREIHFGPSGRADNDIYYKGAWFVHTLRWTVGDEAFFEVLRRWAYPDGVPEEGAGTRFADTAEMRRIAEEVAGRELKWLFDVYLRQPGLPELLVGEEEGALTLRWRVPDDLPFPMPVPVELDGETRRVEVPEEGARIDLAGVGEWRVDPRHRILAVEPELPRGN